MIFLAKESKNHRIYNLMYTDENKNNQKHTD